MTGYQDFVEIFGSGVLIRSGTIAKKYPLQKALASLYILPTFFRGIYYIPTSLERKGHFLERKQDFFTSLFDFHYGRKKWYWGMSTAARYYGVEWSATKILEIVARDKPKTVDISKKIRSLQKKRSYRSRTIAKYLDSLDVNLLYIHKGKLPTIRIDETIGPICSKEQILKDIIFFIPKIRDRRIKNIYKRIAANMG